MREKQIGKKTIKHETMIQHSVGNKNSRKIEFIKKIKNYCFVNEDFYNVCGISNQNLS
jgi:hypothetical protein